MKTFGERLRELRVEKGVSALALGKIIGVSDTAVLRWESAFGYLLGTED